jgi:hypothetical protein
MKYLITLILCIPSLAMATTYNCTYELESSEYALKITTRGNKAKININIAGKKKKYSKCSVNQDDFGTLIDCSNHRLDLMILLNESDDSNSGGIMSSTHDLFLDIQC